MKRGTMLQVLAEFEATLPALLHQPDAWKTLDINYAPPRVERLWLQQGEFRLYLHRLHTCETSEALFHPHPWPSAIRLLDGAYEMGIGYRRPQGQDDGTEVPPEAATIVLHQGSSYEMVDPDGWHYVRPLSGACLSIMVTGKPWDRPSFGKNVKHPPLSDEAKQDLLKQFGPFYK